MQTTKADIEIQVKHINQLIQSELGVDLNLTTDYQYGQPRIVSQEGSHIISKRESKPNLDATLYAVTQILYEIGRVLRVDWGGN
jgi:hypothetical protein